MDGNNNRKTRYCSWTRDIYLKRNRMLEEFKLELLDSKSKSMFPNCHADKVLKIPNSIHTQFYEVWLINGDKLQFIKTNGEMIPACLVTTDDIAIALELFKRKRYKKWRNGELTALL